MECFLIGELKLIPVVWSTGEAPQHKVSKTLMQPVIERCQNAQCITVSCMWGCVATEGPVLTPVHLQTQECQNWIMTQWNHVLPIIVTVLSDSSVLMSMTDSSRCCLQILSPIEHLQDVQGLQVQPTKAQPYNSETDSKDVLLCIDTSEWFWWEQRNLHNVRQVLDHCLTGCFVASKQKHLEYISEKKITPVKHTVPS